MTLSKRERVIRTLELEEVDKCPIYYMGMEQRGWTYQQYLKSEYYKKLISIKKVLITLLL